MRNFDARTSTIVDLELQIRSYMDHQSKASHQSDLGLSFRQGSEEGTLKGHKKTNLDCPLEVRESLRVIDLTMVERKKNLRKISPC
jgi:hypothetical protein